MKSGKAQRTGNPVKNNIQNIEMINAAINYIEAPLKIGSVQACLSPQNEHDEHFNKEYAESQLTSGTNISQHIGGPEQQ